MQNHNVIIVEDEGIVALSIEHSLKERGYTVAGIFPSGEKALDQAGTLEADLVLMDIRLQGELDGIETAAQLGRRFGVPVIFLTAHSDDKTVERATKAGAYGYILKPFHAQELAIAIEVAVHKHRIDREKELLMQELRAALDKVRQLSGLLPICMSCKKIRDDAGYWTQLEQYIESHSEAEFSHGLCSECAEKMYPGYDKDRQ